MKIYIYIYDTNTNSEPKIYTVTVFFTITSHLEQLNLIKNKREKSGDFL